MERTSELKIGVLTFHRCINYGSYWQAKCLVDDLRRRGHNATILDHSSPRINIAEWKCAYRPTLPTAVPESDYPLYRQKILSFFDAFKTLPLSPPFPLDEPGKMEEYDLVIVGSDEVWNVFHPWYAKCKIFYGEGLRAQQLMAYAASFGNYPAGRGLDNEWSGRLYNFDLISVRDENSRRMVQQSTSLHPAIVLDPCLQFPLEPEDRELPFSEPYIALYGHNFSEAFQQKVRAWASRHHLPVISIGYRNDWANEQWLTAGPHEFVHFIRNAKAVATNFFHGCVFSIRFKKPFVCEASDYRSTKIDDLVHRLGTQNRLMTNSNSAADFERCLTTAPAKTVHEKLASLRASSNEFLNRGLGEQQLQVA